MKKIFASVETTAKWDTLKVSCDSTDEEYQFGGKGEIIYGTPDILWNYVAFLQEDQKIWNRGVYYDGSAIDTSKFIEKSETEGLIKNDGTVDTSEYITNDETTNPDKVLKLSKTSEDGTSSVSYIEGLNLTTDKAYLNLKTQQLDEDGEETQSSILAIDSAGNVVLRYTKEETEDEEAIYNNLMVGSNGATYNGSEIATKKDLENIEGVANMQFNIYLESEDPTSFVYPDWFDGDLDNPASSANDRFLQNGYWVIPQSESKEAVAEWFAEESKQTTLIFSETASITAYGSDIIGHVELVSNHAFDMVDGDEHNYVVYLDFTVNNGTFNSSLIIGTDDSSIESGDFSYSFIANSVSEPLIVNAWKTLDDEGNWDGTSYTAERDSNQSVEYWESYISAGNHEVKLNILDATTKVRINRYIMHCNQVLSISDGEPTVILGNELYENVPNAYFVVTCNIYGVPGVGYKVYADVSDVPSDYIINGDNGNIEVDINVEGEDSRVKMTVADSYESAAEAATVEVMELGGNYLAAAVYQSNNDTNSVVVNQEGVTIDIANTTDAVKQETSIVATDTLVTITSKDNNTSNNTFIEVGKGVDISSNKGVTLQSTDGSNTNIIGSNIELTNNDSVVIDINSDNTTAITTDLLTYNEREVATIDGESVTGTTYTKTQVDTLIEGISHFKTVIIQTSHEEIEDPQINTMYFEVLEEGGTASIWMWINASPYEGEEDYEWHKVGDTDIDFSDYATKEYVDEQLEPINEVLEYILGESSEGGAVPEEIEVPDWDD